MTSADIPLIGATILRCAVGAFMIPHGLPKLGLFGGRAFETQTEAFDSFGLRPGQLWSVLVGLTQVGLALLLILGFLTPFAAAGTALLMVASAWIGTRGSGWYWQNHGLEYPIFWALAAVVVALTGPGLWSLDQALGLRFGPFGN